MVEWSINYVASKSILHFKKTLKILLTYGKNLNQNAARVCGIFFIVEKCISWALLIYW